MILCDLQFQLHLQKQREMAKLLSLPKPKITKLWKEILERSIWIRSLNKSVSSIKAFQEGLTSSPALSAGSQSPWRELTTNVPAQVQQLVCMCFPLSNRSYSSSLATYFTFFPGLLGLCVDFRMTLK